MPLPIKFKETIKSKLDDLALLEKSKQVKQSTKKSNSIIDIIERVRQDVEAHLGEYREHYQCITTREDFENYINKANKYGKIAIDTETTGLDPMECDIVGLCLYFPGEKATYVPIGHRDYITDEPISGQLSKEDITPVLKELTANIIMHNAQFDIRVIKHTLGVKLSCWWETQVGATLLNENEPHKLKGLHEKYISHKEEKSFDELFGKTLFSNIPINIAYVYGAHDAIDTFDLYEFQAKFLDPDSDREDFRELYNLYRNIEIPMVDVIVELEDNGVAVDMDYLMKIKEEYHSKLDEALNDCYAEIDKYKDKIEEYKKKNINHKLEDPINIGSSAQLATLFYDILGVKPFKGKKARSVDADIMENLAKKYDIAKAILTFRSATKMTSTYIDNIPNIIKKDGRVHTHFNSNGAKTGRMSSSEPLNLQNIPSRGPNKKLRKMFIGQTTYREVDMRDDNSYVVDRSEEVKLQDGSWQWPELLKEGDILSSGEVVKVVKVKDFKVLIGI